MIYAKKTENTEGDYLAEDETRWDFTAVVKVHDPSGRPPEELGFTAFESEEAALDAWGLTFDPASQGYAEAGPPSPLQGYGVASPLPESEPETDDYGVASPLPQPETGKG